MPYSPALTKALEDELTRREQLSDEQIAAAKTKGRNLSKQPFDQFFRLDGGRNLRRELAQQARIDALSWR